MILRFFNIFIFMIKVLKYTRDYFSLIIYDEIKNNFSIIMRLKICYNKKKRVMVIIYENKKIAWENKCKIR